MSKFLLCGTYTPDGLKGVSSEGGSGRVEAVRKAIEGVGGTLEAYYFALEENDFYIIVDLPDNVTAMSVKSVANVTGTVRVKVITLLTPEEVDKATNMSVDYRAPGE
jgi:uncharacterized protein with GYD domain